MDTRQRNVEQQGVDKKQVAKQVQDTNGKKQAKQDKASGDNEDPGETSKTNKRRKSQSI